MNNIKILLVKPYFPNDMNSQEAQHFVDQLFADSINISKANGVDLLVLPEDIATIENIAFARDKIKNKFPIRVLLGLYSLYDSSSWAVYSNPFAKEGETESKLYCKHSTAKTTAFDLNDYNEMKKELYDPVFLNGLKLQFNICHDMFFPLVFDRLTRGGIDLFINITGGSVNLSKWHNVFQGRSYECAAPIYCTMSYYPEKKVNKADAFCFYNGKFVVPSKKVGITNKKEHEYLFFDTSSENFKSREYSIKSTDEKVSRKDYSIGINVNRNNDLNLFIGNNILAKISSQNVKKDIVNNWLKDSVRSVGVIALQYDDLLERTNLYKINYPKELKHFIIIYYAKERVDCEKVFSLLKLRAIENRIGILFLSPHFRIFLKTNNYKNIMITQPENDVISFDLSNLGGPNSVFSKDNSLIGLSERNKLKYMKLLE